MVRSLNGNWSYVYDPFDRLASSSKNAGAQTFSYDYDRYGNRWHQNAPQGGPAPQYTMDNTSNRISGSGVQYDALGNVTNDGVGNAYTYDAESRLIKVVNLSETFNYAYDAEGRRVSNGTYEFLYDLSGRVVTQFLTSNGVPSHEMIYAGARHVATYSAAVTSFMHADWLGTKRVMTTMAGTNAVTCTGLPFGDGLNCVGNDRDLNEFTGDIHDSESNTEHTWFRQLSAIEGRWLRPDPYLGSIDLTNPQSLNRYGYVGGNPINLFDPFGLEGGERALACAFEGVSIFGPLCDLLYDRLGLNSGGGGNNGGGSTPPQKEAPAVHNDPCANSVLSSAGVSAQQQIATAQGAIAAGEVAGNIPPSGNAVVGFLTGIFGYYEAVHTGGLNDIKNQPRHSAHNPIDIAAGNISFGITCPYGAGFCRFAAGFAQTLGGHPDFNNTLLNGFDTVSDTASIRVGQAMRAAGCHE